ncbi:MAG: DUF2924 domain-containing protein, partial [Alphaproteobacteria bacterium]|nr:DUF2924 domain-containing protein [Alphaproteobacteria bacterium]
MSTTVTTLKEESFDTLRKRWKIDFGRLPSPHLTKGFLARNLAYKAQTQQQGGLNKKTQKRLYQLYDAFKQNPDYRPPESRPSLKPGTRLVREWQGVVHTVTVTANGFDYQGDHFKTLSVIARQITGTRWS